MRLRGSERRKGWKTTTIREKDRNWILSSWNSNWNVTVRLSLNQQKITERQLLPPLGIEKFQLISYINSFVKKKSSTHKIAGKNAFILVFNTWNLTLILKHVINIYSFLPNISYLEGKSFVQHSGFFTSNLPIARWSLRKKFLVQHFFPKFRKKKSRIVTILKNFQSYCC